MRLYSTTSTNLTCFLLTVIVRSLPYILERLALRKTVKAFTIICSLLLLQCAFAWPTIRPVNDWVFGKANLFPREKGTPNRDSRKIRRISIMPVRLVGAIALACSSKTVKATGCLSLSWNSESLKPGALLAARNISQSTNSRYFCYGDNPFGKVCTIRSWTYEPVGMIRLCGLLARYTVVLRLRFFDRFVFSLTKAFKIDGLWVINDWEW